MTLSHRLSGLPPPIVTRQYRERQHCTCPPVVSGDGDGEQGIVYLGVRMYYWREQGLK